MRDRKRDNRYWLFLLCFVFAGGFYVKGQDVKVILNTIDKQVRVGDPFEVQLEITHPEDVVVIFPDSSKDFAPYELVSGSPEPTMTESGVSWDKKVFKLYTWEIDSLQEIRLPGKYLNAKGDTVVVWSNTETLEFLPVLHNYNDTLKVIYHNEVVPIKEPFNFTAWGIIFTTLIIIVGALVIIFRKPILKYFKRKLIERDWRIYAGRINELNGLLASDKESFISGLDKVWRGYFDRKYQLGLPSMTTKELENELKRLEQITKEEMTSLVVVSEQSDEMLYAGTKGDEKRLRDLLGKVKEIMENEYKRRLKEVEI